MTRDGDVLGAALRGRRLDVQAEPDRGQGRDLAGRRATSTARAHTLERLRFEHEAADTKRAVAQERVDAALGRLHESDATMAAVAENLGHLGATARAARGEADRLAAAITKAEESQAGDLVRSGRARGPARPGRGRARGGARHGAARGARRQGLGRPAAPRPTPGSRCAPTRSAPARSRARSTALFEAAEAEREARIKAKERRERQLREAETAKAVIIASDRGARPARAVDRPGIARCARRSRRPRTGREETLRGVRAQLREQIAELDGLTDSVHKDEMARAEMRLRLEGLEGRALEELGLEVETLVADYGPDQLVPPITVEGEDDSLPAEPVPYEREAQVKRLRNAERSMAMLGKVNPLALEEFTALEERHQFLSEQLDDLRKTRQDLLEIVEEVDAKVEQVFTEAWYDVESAFQHVFSRLFPGGEGSLVLTDPQNMLTTGIDVEARPAGKKVKRLSLLSGGERSLVAVAFLVALFKARPSPFYILDEVEAALDDANLGRLLELYEELRANSQLVVITHQKRTMEVADALYGVSMRGDGVSAVISQRLREEETAS